MNSKKVDDEIKDDLLEHARIIVDTLNENGINFWMYGGALLGYVRDGDLIPWDRDLDLFVWKKDYPKVIALRKIFEQKGFRVLQKEMSFTLYWGQQEVSIANYKLEGDIATIRNRLITKNKLGNMIYFGLLIKAVKYKLKRTHRFLRWVCLRLNCCYSVTQIVPAHFYLNLKEIDFFGIKLRVPKETEKYFEYTFGKDWKTPQKDYKYNPEYIFVVEGEKPNKCTIA